MAIVVVGLNHRSAPVEVRERLAFSPEEAEEALYALRRREGVEEAVILSTCNRVEIYAAGREGPSEIVDRIRKFLLALRRAPAAWERHLYAMAEPRSLRHLFRVAAGLDSMVLGETEIFGQLKQAYKRAHRFGTTGRFLNRSFQAAFRASKRIRSETRIQRGNVSVSSVAVDLAQRVFENLNELSVLVVGAGETGRKAARALASRGAKRLWVTNRSPERARRLAEELGASAVPFEEWIERLAEADVLVACTAAPHCVLDASALAAQLPRRRGQPLLVVDIAVPRDVDPAVGELEGVFLYDIDDLREIAKEARRQRERELAVCESLIEQGVKELMEAIDRGASFRRPACEG